MQPTHWNMYQKKQCKTKYGQAMLSGEHQLVFFEHDFGHLIHAKPFAVFEPTNVSLLQSFIEYAYENSLPITLRGKGMSQNGQSLSSTNVIISMNKFIQCDPPENDEIWVDANATWSDLLQLSLKTQRIPYVLPYNCNLSIGGVLSAGGIGASSFKYGSVIAHVKALEIIKTNGELVQVDAEDALAQACLGGQGLFGVILRACIKLRPCLPHVRTFILSYLDKDAWLADLKRCQSYTDYIESFATPAVQGTKLTPKGRAPFAQWLYAIQLSMEFDAIPPEFQDLQLSPWKLQHTQEEPIVSFLHRHNSRFEIMKLTGQWELPHPWYECFLPEEKLENLTEILSNLPLFYANIVQLIPMSTQYPTGFLMLPRTSSVFSFMILNPGIAKELAPACIEVINYLDSQYLPEGKRYLSGYWPKACEKETWKMHFAERYSQWVEAKKTFDPRGILTSHLFE